MSETISRHRKIMPFIIGTVTLDMMGFGIIIPVQPAIIQSLSDSTIGEASFIGAMLFFIAALLQFISGPTLGNLSDAFGRRPLLLLSVFGLGVDFLLTAFAPSLTWLFIARGIAGICGASYVIANAAIADIYPPEERPKAFGMLGAAFGIGFVLGPVLGGVLAHISIRAPFYAAAGISLINFLIGYFYFTETLGKENRRKFEWKRANPFGVFKVFASYKNILVYLAVFCIYSFFSSVYPAIWPFWAIAKFGWGPDLIGYTLAGFGISHAIVVGVFSGPAEKYFGSWNLAFIGLMVGASIALVYPQATGIWTLIFILMIHAPEGFVQPIMTSLMSSEVPADAQGELQGGIAGAQSFLMMLGTIFFGFFFNYFMEEGAPIVSPDVTFYIASFGIFVAAALFITTRKKALALEAEKKL